MAQSLSQMYVHIIFHVKSTSSLIRKEEKLELFSYLGAIIKDNSCIPILINGIDNHIHVLCVLSKNIAVSKLIEEIKRHSSRWIKTKDTWYKDFAWQGGYGVFSVSPSVLEKTKMYIANQDEHHKKLSFKEEYMLFLQEYQIEYDEKYVWID